jgi:putative sigma-54 modulation protein
VKIAVRHGHLSENTQRIIRDKAEKLLHFFERLTMIEVTVDLNHRGDGRPPEDRKALEDKCRVEFVVQAEHKHDFVAHESHVDVLAAVDLALDKIEGQVRRYKEKIQDHRRRPSVGDVAGGQLQERVGEGSAEAETEKGA